MSFQPYERILFLPDGLEMSPSLLAERLAKQFERVKGARVAPEGDHVLIELGNWGLRVSYADEPELREESALIVTEYGTSRPDHDVLASCARWITTGSDPDPNMDHFDDFLRVVEFMEELQGPVLFIPSDGIFVDRGDFQ